MGAYGELFPGRKLRHEGGEGAVGREHDPGGPLDLERGVVFLAPLERDGSTRNRPGSDQGTPQNGQTSRDDAAEPGDGT